MPLVQDEADGLFLRDRGQVSSKNLVLFSRISVLVLMLLSVWLAFSAQEFVFWMVLFAFGGLGACFGPALLLTFYWKRTTGPGILAGMITGLITVILVKKQPEWTYSFLTDMKELVGKMLFGVTYEAVPGFLVALIVTVLVSLATRKPENADQVVDDLKKIA